MNNLKVPVNTQQQSGRCTYTAEYFNGTSTQYFLIAADTIADVENIANYLLNTQLDPNVWGLIRVIKCMAWQYRQDVEQG